MPLSLGNLRTQQIQTQHLVSPTHFWLVKQGRSSASWTVLSLVIGIIGRVCCIIHITQRRLSTIGHHHNQFHGRCGLFVVLDLKWEWMWRTERDVWRSCEVPLCLFSVISPSRGVFYILVTLWFTVKVVTFYPRGFNCFKVRFSWKYLGVVGRTWAKDVREISLKIFVWDSSGKAVGLFVSAGKLIEYFHISTFLYTHIASLGGCTQRLALLRVELISPCRGDHFSLESRHI